MKKTPPRLGLLLIEWMCSYDYLEMVQGDIVELYQARMETGKRRAYWQYYADCLHSAFLFYNKGHSNYSTQFISMLRINLISSFRNLRKSKLNTAISLFGLGTAFASSFLIYQYVHFERSYDNYHDDFEHIYRIETSEKTENSVTKTAYSILGLGLFAKDEIPEIEAAFSTLVDLAEYSQVSRQLDNGQIHTVRLDNYHNVTSPFLMYLPLILSKERWREH